MTLISAETKFGHDPIDHISGTDLYQTDVELIVEAAKFAHCVSIGSGGLYPVPEGEAASSLGAANCITGVAIGPSGLILFHSFGDDLTRDQKFFIEKSYAGIIGGGAKLLDRYKSLFREKNFQSIKSADPNGDFNVLVVNKNELQLPYIPNLEKRNMDFSLSRGIHYGYGNILTDGNYARYKGK